MLKVTFSYAIILILLGVGFYGYVHWRDGGQVEFVKGITSLIPAFVGLIALLCACVAVVPKYRMHAMHVAVLLGLLATLIGCGMGISGAMKWLAGNQVRQLAVVLQLAMGVISLAFVALCVRSFIAARIARKKAAA